MGWTPVLDGAAAEQARGLVAAIVAELAARDLDDPSLASGQAGIALLHGYRARAGHDDGADLAFAALARALENITSRPEPWLFSGYAGIAFAMHHLADVVGDAEDTLGELDALIAQPLTAPVWNHEWELATGLIGLGVYGIERGAPAIVARAVEHLAARAEVRPEGIAWRTHDPDDLIGFHNLGIAHGVAGAIGFLAEVCAGSGAPPIARDLLRGAVHWLRACERPDTTPAYTMTLGRHQAQHPEILDGWCYGDPSTALMFVRAGQALDEPGWVTVGHALATRAARRTAAQLATLTIDATLCHGAISHAHLYHRLATALDDAELLEAARRWYLRVLERTTIDQTAKAGLQLGLTGIGLGLVASYSDIDPAWDRILLLR